MTNKEVRIVADLNWFGHIPMYHRFYVRAFLDLGYRVVSLSPRPDQVVKDPMLAPFAALGQLHVKSYSKNALPSEHEYRLSSCLAALPGGSMLWNTLRSTDKIRQWRARRRWSKLMGRAKEIARSFFGGARLFIPYLDDLLHVPQLRSEESLRWAGLYLDSSRLRNPISSSVRRSLAILNDESADYIAVLDEGSVAFTQEHCPRAPVISLPDFTDGSINSDRSSLADKIVAKAKGRPIVSILGHLTPRKGVKRLVSISQVCAPDLFFYLFAGKVEAAQFDPKTRAFLQRASDDRISNAYAYLERLPEEADINALVKISDVIYARYNNFFGSSNILTKAALFHRPVIVTSIGCMAERVDKYRLGEVFQSGDEQVELALISKLLDSRSSEFTSHADAYVRRHCYDALITNLRSVESAIR